MRRSQSRVEEQTDQLIRVRDLALPLLAVNRVVGGVAEPESHETI